MKTTSVSGLALAATSFFASFTNALQWVEVDGANFVTNGTGNRFTIIGVDYQPGGSSGVTATKDPLSNADVCLRDAILMQRLGVNTIRVYNVKPEINHDECVSIFNAAGIYMILDVNNGDYGSYIDRTAPWTTYTKDYLQHVFSVIEAFAHYPNLIGFFSGNEIINEDSARLAPAYIRAVTRDMKDYIKSNIGRDVPVGYSAADVESQRSDTWEYLGCELANATNSKIDFYGLNSYSFCGESSFTESGYDKLIAQFGETSIPVFFSEFGCNEVKPRKFSEVPVIYSDQMSVMSGGLVYEFSQAENEYGLTNIKSDKEITLLDDYQYLAAQYAKLDVKALQAANMTATSRKAPECKPGLITHSEFVNYWDLPKRPDGVDALIKGGLAKANKGQMVDVTKTAMPATVYGPGGKEIKGLKLTIVEKDASNVPGLTSKFDPADTPDGSSPSSSSGSSSSTKGSSGSSPKSTGSGDNSTTTGAASSLVPVGGMTIAAFFMSLLFV